MPGFSPPGSENAAAVHIDEITAGAEAIKKASVKMSDKMMDDIIKNFQKRVGATTLVQLTILGLAGAEDLRKFKSSVLGQVRGVEGIHETELFGKCRENGCGCQRKRPIPFPGDEPKEFPGVHIKVIRSTWNTLEVQVSPK